MRITKTVLITALLFSILFGCKQAGQLTGKLLTSSTDNLEEAATQIQYMRNLWPSEAETPEVGYFDGWQEGRHAVSVNSFKRDGLGLLKIDGQVSASGTSLPYLANGAYGMLIDDLDPQTVSIETSSGQRVTFEVGPIAPVELTSVNGGTDEIDLTQDLVLEFNEPADAEHKNMRLTVHDKLMGVQTWRPVVHFEADDKVTIPAEAFRHLPNSLDLSTGETHIMVERYYVSPTTHEGIGAAQVLSLSYDTRKVTLSGDVDMIETIEATGSLEDEAGGMEYTATKSNAFTGRPMKSGKKFGLASLSVRATQKTTETQLMQNQVETRTLKFPDSFWEDLLEKMYSNVVPVLEERLEMEIIPVEQVISAPSYGELTTIGDEDSEAYITRTYKDTRSLIPTSVSAIMSEMSSTFASDRVDARLIRELGVDGLISITLDLELPEDAFTLEPKMSFRVSGLPNGYKHGPTIYAQGVIQGEGMELNEATAESEVPLDVLDNVVRREQLVQAFDRALKELMAKEQDYNYKNIWALQE